MAEILETLVPVMADVGLTADSRSCEIRKRFFTVSTSIHNGLPGMALPFDESIQRTWRYYNELNAHELECEDDFIVVHDPRPSGLPHYHYRGRARGSFSIWGCHIDTSQPNPDYWDFYAPFINEYDRMIFTMPHYAVPRSEAGRVTVSSRRSTRFALGVLLALLVVTVLVSQLDRPKSAARSPIDLDGLTHEEIRFDDPASRQPLSFMDQALGSERDPGIYSLQATFRRIGSWSFFPTSANPNRPGETGKPPHRRILPPIRPLPSPRAERQSLVQGVGIVGYSQGASLHPSSPPAR